MKPRNNFEAADTERDARGPRPPSDNAAIELALQALNSAERKFDKGLARIEGMADAMRALAVPRWIHYGYLLFLATLAYVALNRLYQ